MKNVIKDNNDVIKSIPNLVERANMLSTEDFDTFVKNISSFFTNKIHSISEVFSTNSRRTSEISEKDLNVFVKELVNLKKDMEWVVNNVKYNEVSYIKIPVMLGSKTNLVETLHILKVLMDSINKNLDSSLEYTDTFVSKVLTDKNFRLSTRPIKQNKEKDELIETFYKSLNNLIDENGTTDNKKVSELLPNISSLELVYQDIINIAKGTSIKDIRSIENKLTKISEKTNELYNLLLENKDTEISRVVINELAYDLETTAKLVTNVVSVIHVYNQTVTTIKFLIQRLKK